MPENTETPGERRISLLYERMAALEKVVELTLQARGERITALENLVSTALQGKGGVLERLAHFDSCMDSIKRTVWMATGAVMIVSVAANLLTRGH